MFKKKMFALLCCMFLACSLFCNFTASAADAPTYITSFQPTASQIVSEVCSAYGLPYQTWDYYILSSPMPETLENGSRRYFSLFLTDPQYDCDIHILNENYNVNGIATPFKCIAENDVNRGCFLVTLNLTKVNDELIIDYFGGGNYIYNNNNEIGFADARNFYASNMSVFVGDVNVNETLYSADIFYTSDTATIHFQVNNLTDDVTLGYLYGIEGYNITNGGSVIPDDTSFSQLDALAFLQWCTANDLNYNNFNASIDVYRGIDLVGSLSVPVGDLIDGGDDFYDHELPLPEAPDYSDYINDPPEMPSMPDLPPMPDFDPEHPLDSIADLIVWVVQCLLVPLRYIGTLLGWIMETIGYYLGGLLHYLLDLFAWIVECLGVFVYNLIVKLKGLLYKLFVPSKLYIDSLMAEHFPFITQIRNIFTDIAFSGSTSYSITLFGHSYTFSFVSILGVTWCSAIAAMTSVYIDCVCIYICYKSIKGLLNFAQ